MEVNSFQILLVDVTFYLFYFFILFISICHDNGVVQHKLQKMFASTIYIQTMLSLKKTML